jgi:hypothetical protein
MQLEAYLTTILLFSLRYIHVQSLNIDFLNTHVPDTEGDLEHLSAIQRKKGGCGNVVG